MGTENYRLIAGLIAAHPGRRIYGRTRLQKEVKLLQRLDFPTDYSYTIHFYGPYSEGLQADICLLESFGMVGETIEVSLEGKQYYVLSAKDPIALALPEIATFQDTIKLLDDAPTVVLELAATYDAFRDSGSDHHDAVARLRRKKGPKCGDGNEERSLELLKSLGLPTT
ncbi:MAG: hypothetical protein JW809_12315 [Pirellulales bacterium]|nr:hypothetical protein [Pirellulales bacterium]